MTYTSFEVFSLLLVFNLKLYSGCVCVMCICVYHGVYVDITGQLAGICSPTTRVLSAELSLASAYC